MQEGSNKHSIKPNPLANWDNTREYTRIGTLIARNRKLLRDQFENITKGQGTNVNYEQAKQTLEALLQPHFKDLTEEKIRSILKVGEA